MLSKYGQPLGLMNNIYIILLFFIVFLFTACGPTIINQPEKKKDQTSEELIKVNQYLVKKDNDLIKSYLKRHQWNMLQTETGLWYMVYKQGRGEKVEKGKPINLKYKLELLDGTLCYSSETHGNKQFNVGSGGVESGLEEGILLLKEGDAARFILLPHLGQGYTGDGNKIPPRSILVYDVEVMKSE